MIILEGTVSGDSGSILSSEESEKGFVLSCLSHVESDLTVEIPETTPAGDRLEMNMDAERFKADAPGITTKEFARGALVLKLFLELDEPTLENNYADFERVKRQVEKLTGASSICAGLDLLKKLPKTLK